jgi:SAM-dependent methyltransferase
MTPASPLGRYRGETWSTRAHLHVRWRSCPFAAVVAALPDEGPVLDIGCGHGLLAVSAAREDRPFLGLDVSAERIAVANRAAGAVPPVAASFDLLAEALPGGPFAAVTVVDVLYLLPEPHQRDLLARARSLLEPGGSLVVKEMDTRPRWKAGWIRSQERLATGPLGITRGGAGLHFTSNATQAAWLDELGLTTTVQRLDRRRPWPHTLVVGTDRHTPPRVSRDE